MFCSSDSPESSLLFFFFCWASLASAIYSINCLQFQALVGLPYLPEFLNNVYNAYRSIDVRGRWSRSQKNDPARQRLSNNGRERLNSRRNNWRKRSRSWKIVWNSRRYNSRKRSRSSKNERNSNRTIQENEQGQGRTHLDTGMSGGT